MKNTFLILLMLIGSLNMSTQGQKNDAQKSPIEIAQMRADLMKVKLNLTEEQRNQVYKLVLDEAKTKEAERKAQQIRIQQNDAAFKKILTEEQYNKFTELNSKRRERQKKQGRPGNMKSPNPGQGIQQDKK